ncbi:MAG: bacterioferritin-associated ferredoxin [Lysobacteraceae bacterium]|nr:MAG: bacterioferritin-associated ferredoxin [Xanthomonadaceae bacterium]
MYVCICNGVTDHQVREAAANGVRSLAELTMRTGCGSSCGTCLDTASTILEEHATERRAAFHLPLLGAGVSQAA